MTKRFLSVLSALLFALMAQASIVINEIMPKNISNHVDDKFQFSAWAELYNNGAESVDISLYFFSDNAQNPTQWQMVTMTEATEDKEERESFQIILAPGERKVFYFDESEDVPYHVNFKLHAKKGQLVLANEKGAVVDKIEYDTTYRNVSYGRIVDGGEQLGYFTNPTPNAANDGSSVATAKTAMPQFMLQPGFYTSEQKVKITAPEGATIYFTTNGSEPKVNGQKYEGEITVNRTTPLRAIAYINGEMSSDVATATYFINENVNKLPIVSLNSDPELLYGNELGLLVAGTNGKEVPRGCNGPDEYANYENDWDRPCNFEFFDNQKQEHLNQEVKIGNFGACSRTKYIKSIKVNAGKVYGDNELDYPLFSEKPNLRWKSIVLRNAGNDYGRSYLRDGFIQTLMITGGMDLDHQAYQPSMVFINGEFHGMLNIRERTNKDFIFSNYGLSEDEFYINEGNWNNGHLDYGALEDSAKSKNINAPWMYDKLDEMMDINEFLNYFIAEIFCGNSDWPGGNIKCWKACKEGAKWRWILYDTEFSTSIYGNTSSANGLNTAKAHHVFGGVINNSRIKEKLLGKLSVHLATTFDEKHSIHVLDSLIGNIQPDVQRYIDKIIAANKLEKDFDTDIADIKKFLRERVPAMYKHIKRQFKVDTLPIRIYSDVKGANFTLNDEPIRISDFNGYFYTGIPFTITATEPNGYRFSHWELTKPDGETITINNLAYQDTFAHGKNVLKAVYAEDKDYNPNAPQIFINEICASNSVYVDEYRQAEDWFEIYNKGDKEFNLGGLFLSVSKDNLGMYKIPASDSVIVPANGYKVFWADNDDEQGVLHTNFKLPVSTRNTLILSSLTMKGSDSIFTIIDSVEYKTHRENESYARFAYNALDGKWMITGKTTFGARNIFGLNSDIPVVSVDDAVATVYPNPVKDMIYFALPWDEKVEAAVITLGGQIVKEFDVRDGDSQDLSTMKKGIYVLMMQTPKGKVAAKLIKE